MLNILIGISILLFLLAFFLQIISKFTGLDKTIDYAFLSVYFFLMTSILLRVIFKISVDAGYMGFEGHDCFVLAKDKETCTKILNEKNKHLVFRTGFRFSVDGYLPVSFL